MLNAPWQPYRVRKTNLFGPTDSQNGHVQSGNRLYQRDQWERSTEGMNFVEVRGRSEGEVLRVVLSSGVIQEVLDGRR